VFPSGSGSEANSLAIKIAHKIANKSGGGKIYVAAGGFHGRDLIQLNISRHPTKDLFAPYIDNICWFDTPDQIGDDCVAILMSPVACYHELEEYSNEYWGALQYVIARTGALLIFDEIQVGSGRTGSYFAHRNHTNMPTPDIVTLAKGVAGGFPVAFTLMNKPYLDVGEHFSTYSGQVIGLVWAIQATRIIQKQCAKQITYNNVLRDLLAQFEEYIEITGTGNLVGINFKEGVDTAAFSDSLLQNHFIFVPAFGDSGIVKLNWNFNIHPTDVRNMFGRICQAVEDFVCL